MRRNWDDWGIPDGGPADAVGDGDDPKRWRRLETGDRQDPAPGPLDRLIAAEEAEIEARELLAGTDPPWPPAR